jgi:steroid delta-isomerase-like uncharacterized protein
MSVLDSLYQAYNGHDPDAAAALYAADGEHEDVAHGRPRRGDQAIAEGLRRFLAAVPDARWETSDRIVAGDRAVARYVLSGTLQGDLGPFRARGQRIVLRGVQVLELRSGRIARSEDFWDGATFERQLNQPQHRPRAVDNEERTA